jgi:serine/threonine protein kinase
MATIDQYTLEKTLGSGFSAKVKLASDPQGNQYALKIFDLNNPQNSGKAMELLKKEVESTQKLDHHNIVKYYAFKENSTQKKKSGETVPVAYIAQEPVLGGELFDYVANTGPFNEEICRYYFKQMLLGLHYLHSQGYAHRDLKPENILLDKNFDVKLVDFGFACPLEGRDGTGFSRSVIGTPGYMAPEILDKQPYQGQVVDLFACGVILFIMLTQHPPFQMANCDDMYYKLLATNRSDLFWKAHSNRKPAGFFSDEFKDLITCMLQLHPHQRLCMADVIGHPWMQGPMASPEQVREEFAKRHEVNAARAKEEEDKKALAKNKNAGRTRRGQKIKDNVYMSGNLSQADKDDPNVICLNMKPYNPNLAKTTAFFTDYTPEQILKELTDSLSSNAIAYNISDKTWKVTFTKTRDEGSEESKEGEQVIREQASIQIELLDAGDGKVCVEFKRKQGSSMIFYDQFNMLRDEIGHCNNVVV